jgi:hypothetical protein
LRKNPKVFGLGIVVGSGNKPMSEQIGYLLGRRTVGVEPCGKGMTQAMRAIPANKSTATIGPVHYGGDGKSGQWPASQKVLTDEELLSTCGRSVPKIVA